MQNLIQVYAVRTLILRMINGEAKLLLQKFLNRWRVRAASSGAAAAASSAAALGAPTARAVVKASAAAGPEIVALTLEDRKYGYFWIFPHHSCENIQKYFEFLDTFGYSPIISEPISKI